MNQQTFTVLDFEKIKQEAAQYALTDSGKKAIMDIYPVTNAKQIEGWLDEVTEAKQILAKSASVPIHGLEGIELIMKQLHKGVPLRPDALTKLYFFLDTCRKLKRFMKDKEFLAPRVSTYVYSLAEIPQVAEEIIRCIRNGMVDQNASKELNRIRKQIMILEERLKDKISQMVKSGKYKPYLQEAIVSERNGRYCLSVKKEHKGKIKGSILDASASGSTLFIEPDELAVYQEELSYLQTDESIECERILSYLTGLVEANEQELKIAVETMIHYDQLFAKAKYSLNIEGTSVKINQDHYIDLHEAKHPLLGKNAVPLTVEMGNEYDALVITGPNTGGKTVAIKTVGLLTLMVQSGFHIPVKEGSEVSIFQKILVDIGDGQSIEQNLSTFSSRIVNIIEVLKEANDHSLILIDEIGSGTDPSEGMGLATAILDELYRKGATILATTHYNEIKEFADQTDGFVNGSMEFDIETLKPTHRLLVGKGGDSQAFAIALRLGIHPAIISRAHNITYKEEKSYGENELNPNDKRELDKQLALNRYARRKKPAAALPKKEGEKNAPRYQMGDNVKITASDEFGIVYAGPDSKGDYIVQIRGEKHTINHKRFTLYISAAELYPADYDFSIIFDSKENRRIDKQMSKGHKEGLTIEHE
ncbi:endonuclease MutS2 [Falsibacillus pallidus]|uniref:MutS2 family protein n=1 Tax=Falsibacillus pallidus TaxID=493781 RepID=A0A370GHT9_9BACI|nr:endonuclease MutS2 [Falsibacillus pallidus]RDI43221.1 MutS2 family protein [Falsibacillus pallidus]